MRSGIERSLTLGQPHWPHPQDVALGSRRERLEVIIALGFPPVQNGQNSPSLRRLLRMDNPIPKILVARQPLERLFGHQMTIWQDKGSTRHKAVWLHRANFPPITGGVDVGRSEFTQFKGGE